MMVKIIIFILLLITTNLVYANTAEICNESPFPIFVSYVYPSNDPGEWEKIGWYNTLPGDCTKTKEVNGQYYYFYAQAASSDIVTKHLNASNYTWGGQGEANSVELCITNQEFSRYSGTCEKNDYNAVFGRRAFGQRVILTCPKCDPVPRSLEEAGILYHGLQGQIRYGDSILKDPKGVPFKAGIEIESDDIGPFVTKVYSGFPAYNILSPGDRIEKVLGHTTKTVFDVIYRIQEFGYRTETSKRQIPVTIIRYSDAFSGRIEVNLPLVYFRFLEDRIDITEGRAAAIALMDGIAFNTSPYIACIGKYLYNEIESVPKQHRQIGCIDKLRMERSRAKELHNNIVTTFDFIGSLTSPRLILKLGAKGGSKYIMRRVGLAMADESLQSAISSIGWAGGIEEVKPPELLKTMAVGAIAGGVVGLVLR